MIVYGVSIIGTVPFMKLSFFEGYLAQLIGADISWIAGLVLAGLLYFIFHMNRAPAENGLLVKGQRSGTSTAP